MRSQIFLLLLAEVILPIACLHTYPDIPMFKDAVEAVKKILDNTREPILPEDADHTYEDKYALVEFVTNSFIAASVNALNPAIITDEFFDKLLVWANEENQPVTLESKMDAWCDFDSKKERTETVTKEETVNLLSSEKEKKKKTVTVKKPKWEYHFFMKHSYQLTIRSGQESVELRNDVTSIPLTKTFSYDAGDKANCPMREEHAKKEVNLTWLLQMISKDKDSLFVIDRFHESCKTPNRNKDIDRALEFHKHMNYWVHQNIKFFRSKQQSYSSHLGEDTHNDGTDVFVPITVVFDNSTVLSNTDMNQLLNHQAKTLESKIISNIEKNKNSNYFSSADKTTEIIYEHITELLNVFLGCVGYVENMLEVQLFQAIGKEITPDDFDKFMKFHQQNFFHPQFTPSPFSYAIRRPDHYPDGFLSIETSIGGGEKAPIQTLVRRVSEERILSSSPMLLPIDATTKVTLQGEQYLHGWIQHVWNFHDKKGRSQLVARAHQFSSFLVVIGVMGGSGTFLPKEAIILQNKDQVLIPLINEVLPSAKEFKDAIVSMSPEQRSFAKAFRNMQLESSVFGVCVIQLKPQLERLLNLEEGSLTKEIQLTQDLMSLFIDYQIPSDLLSFDDSNLDRQHKDYKIRAVKSHVSAVLEVIDIEKKRQLDEAKAKEEMRKSSRGYDEAYAQYMMAPDISMMAPDIPVTMVASSLDSSLKRGAVKAETIIGTVEKGRESQSEAMEFIEEDIKSEESLSKHDDLQNEKDNSNRNKVNSKLQQHNVDFTLIPKLLDAKIEEYDKAGSLRSTVLTTSKYWLRERQDNLLARTKRSHLPPSDIASEKHKAMSLLTAISRGGSLPIVSSELHIIISVSHYFEKDVVRTIIEDNINPIADVEKSLLMIGSVIHEQPPQTLLAPSFVTENKNLHLTKAAKE